ncbi:mitochondrial basic amino acids transporter-like [Diadema setosum]|uniref:mitochondrial basic amino acids transporter-like n=1 Tax=Diadema antillarum TaxID=105358 RepID=UPI003A87D969
MAADFIAGTIGGAAGVLVGHPFDTVKVRLQMQSSLAPKYNGIIHCFVTIAKQETVFGLFKGMASPLLGLTFINTIVFGVQGNIMRRFEEPTLFSHFLAGATAGAVQSTIAGPMELAKTRVQVQRKGTARYHGSLDAIYKIYKSEGLRGCYRGFALTAMRDTPGFAVYFMAYEFYCSHLANLHPQGQIGVLGLLTAGGLSGMTSWVMAYNLDVMKTRIQADGMEGKNKYNGIIDVFRKSYRAEGISVMTKGLGATLLRAFPVNAATFTGATLTLQLLGQTNNNSSSNGKRES